MEIEYRHPTEADAEDIAQIGNLSGRELKHHTDTTADDVLTWTFGDKDYDPKGHLLALVDGRAVGYLRTIVLKACIEAGNNNARADISVVPEWRGKGIEEHLLGFAVEYLRSRNITALRFGVSKDFTWKANIAKNAGMTDVRHFYMMVCAGNVQSSVPGISMGYTLHNTMMAEASDAALKDLANVVNDSFADGWNFFPMEVERLSKSRDEEKRTGDSESRLIFAKYKNQVVGACVASIIKDYNKQHYAKAGWSSALGVVKAHRRSGLGRALLADSMTWLQEKGMDTFYLGVDAENDRALNLYTSLGYTVEQESITYELKL